MDGRTSTRGAKREFERATTTEENKGKEALERYDRLCPKMAWQVKRERLVENR